MDWNERFWSIVRDINGVAPGSTRVVQWAPVDDPQEDDTDAQDGTSGRPAHA